jgi:tyrosine-protein phosphatase SIW14
MKLPHLRRVGRLPRMHWTRVNPLRFVLCLTFLLTAISPLGAQEFPKIANSGEINPNYYRGSQPKASEFAELKRAGIRTVIDLQSDGEPREPAWVNDAGMQYFRIPLSSRRPANAEQTEYFLRLVNDPANWPVFVHCAGGRHRTGEMTAIYRIAHDSWTADQAAEEMKKYDYYSIGGHGPLKDYVFEFYRKYIPSKTASASIAEK